MKRGGLQRKVTGRWKRKLARAFPRIIKLIIRDTAKIWTTLNIRRPARLWN